MDSFEVNFEECVEAKERQEAMLMPRPEHRLSSRALPSGVRSNFMKVRAQQTLRVVSQCKPKTVGSPWTPDSVPDSTSEPRAGFEVVSGFSLAPESEPASGSARANF